MFKRILFFIAFTAFIPLSASSLVTKTWPVGTTYLNFLEKNHLPLKLYYSQDREDQKVTEDIAAGIKYELLIDDNGSIEQALIPVNDALQIQIYRTPDGFKFQTTPLLLDKKREAFTFKLRTSPYNDIMHYTQNRFLAQEFVWAYKNSLNFHRELRKDDDIVIIYTQKYRNGLRFGYPEIEVAMIEVRNKPRYIYRNKDGRYYNAKGKEIEGFMLSKPIKNGRITSRFSLRRFHPILHRYRAHLGIDFGARPGTPIHAAASGRISYMGTTRGYGSLIKIRHADGYMTLYAHMRSFRKGMRRGKYVKQNSVIGYVGTSGLSTGPHLHFGLYKNGRARNPLGVIRITTNILRGKKLKAFKALKKRYNEEIALHLKAQTKPHIEEPIEPVCYLGANNPINNAEE